MTDFTPSSPEKEQITLFLPEKKIEIKNFTEYSFNSNFLTPTDGWSFTVGAEHLSKEMREAMVPGAAVTLTLNGGVQSSGYIDSLEISASRGSGTEYRIEGRDRLGQVVDACADPTQSLKAGQSLGDAMRTLFGPFGWTEDDDFIESNEAARNVKTGGIRPGKTRRSEARGFGRRQIKREKLHQLRPYPREGVFAFASRIAQRFGCWIWLTPTGDQVVLSKPDFDTDPFYQLRRNSIGTTNVLDGSVKFDMSDQPTVIIADSYSAGGEFGRGRVKTIFANVAMIVADGVPDFDWTKYTNAGASVLGGHTIPASSSMTAPRHRVLYLHDDESQNQEHLDNYVRREMALLQRKSLSVSYTVEGHGQMTPQGFVPWTVDTTVDVEDEPAGLLEELYILGRTFNKSRQGGTTTHLELIRRNTLVF